jgi:hypothetical protein
MSNWPEHVAEDINIKVHHKIKVHLLHINTFSTTSVSNFMLTINGSIKNLFG